MEIARIVLQIIVALGIFNVWIVRFNKATAYRGGKANNMMTEFSTYGLPAFMVFVVGFLKMAAAILLIIGIWFSYLVLPSSIVIAALMLGAVLMHVKIRDTLKKTFPSVVMLLLSVAIAILS